MTNRVSKSRFKAQALELFREVERTGHPLIITDRGTPVLKVVPYRNDPGKALRMLRDTVIKYQAPTEPVAEQDWESAK